MEEKPQLTYKYREWWLGLIIVTLLIAAISIFVSDVMNGTPDETIPPNDLMCKIHN
jgi:hypothetical protein